MIESKYMTEGELNAHESLQKQVTEAWRNLTRQHIKLSGLPRDDSRVVNIKLLYSQLFNLSDYARKRAKVPEEDMQIPLAKSPTADNPYIYQIVDRDKGQIFKGHLEDVANYLGIKVTAVYGIRSHLRRSGKEFNIDGIRVDKLGREKDGF